MNDDSRHRVLLVREWDHQTTGASCCGRLDSAGDFGGAADFARARVDMEAMGCVYRALVAALAPDGVEVQVVDPRNITWLLPSLVRDAWRAEPRIGHVLHVLRRGTAQGAVVVDGRVASTGPIPDAEVALGLVRDAMATP